MFSVFNVSWDWTVRTCNLHKGINEYLLYYIPAKFKIIDFDKVKHMLCMYLFLQCLVELFPCI
jgi:hypothetical protein